MECHIQGAKNSIKKIVDYMADTQAIKVRIGFCGYRDHCDNSDRLQIFNFTDSCEEFMRNLSDVVAIGDGNGPKDVLGGLDAAITEMSWRNRIRVLLHIGDCPPHGRRFTNTDDDYPDGDPNGLTAERVLEEMQSIIL